MQQLIPATDATLWRSLLARFGELDPTFLPEYHQAYSLRIPGSRAVLWHFTAGDAHLLYPFLLTPVDIGQSHTGYYDISSIYGYTGPIATSAAPEFLSDAWRQFDQYTAQQNIIAEFIRFSPYNRNERFAHPQTRVEANRALAVSTLPENETMLLQQLGPKTRNMLRKATRSGLTARALALPEYLPQFRALYEETMQRNRAPDFFKYDDAYWQKLSLLGSEGLRLFGVFSADTLVAAAMAVVYGKTALYHLGASKMDFVKLGAGNLSLFEMSRDLMQVGVSYINMTGGRSLAADDPLLLFKKSNATGLATFYIGKRIIDRAAYQHVGELWRSHTNNVLGDEKIIFWRN